MITLTILLIIALLCVLVGCLTGLLTLVGVLGIDSLLFAQGFRAYETVFSLVTQVVGRSGRAKDPGFAIIQTTDPDNPVLNLAAAQDYDAFFEQEIAYRKLGLKKAS